MQIFIASLDACLVYNFDVSKIAPNSYCNILNFKLAVPRISLLMVIYRYLYADGYLPILRGGWERAQD